jgi:hypothetical protein
VKTDLKFYSQSKFKIIPVELIRIIFDFLHRKNNPQNPSHYLKEFKAFSQTWRYSRSALKSRSNKSDLQFINEECLYSEKIAYIHCIISNSYFCKMKYLWNKCKAIIIINLPFEGFSLNIRCVYKWKSALPYIDAKVIATCRDHMCCVACIQLCKSSMY